MATPSAFKLALAGSLDGKLARSLSLEECYQVDEEGRTLLHCAVVGGFLKNFPLECFSREVVDAWMNTEDLQGFTPIALAESQFTSLLHAFFPTYEKPPQ
jgi:hypothetical protein